MMKSLIATTLAGALAFGSIAQPVAAADRSETTRTILGIAALAALGVAIANSNNNRYHPAPVTRHAPWPPRGGWSNTRPDDRRDWRRDDHHDWRRDWGRDDHHDWRRDDHTVWHRDDNRDWRGNH